MLTRRSQEKELIDLGPNHYTKQEYTDCLRKLFKVNIFFGFFRSTVKILKSFSPDSTLIDIGCGGGLFILNLSRYYPLMKLKGTDISQEAVNDAILTLDKWQKNNQGLKVSFQQINEHQKMEQADIILMTLVCHHFEDDELVNFLSRAYQAAGKAIIINDLQRNRLAGILYSLISPILFRNRLINHDGLISIQKGFLYSELKRILQEACIHHYKIKWCFPFRWQVILYK